MNKRIYFNHISGNIHPVYQEMLASPPSNTEYINANNFLRNYEKTVEIHRSKERFSFFINIVKKIYLFPNFTYVKEKNDLIYSCQSIPIFGNFILDLDCYEGLNRFSNKISRNFLNKLLVKFFLSQSRCKAIIFWSDAAKKGFEKYIGKSYSDKCFVVYPHINTSESPSIIKTDFNKDFLFVGRYFERKGGIITLELFKKILLVSPESKLYIISEVSEEIKNKYKNDNIIFLGLLPRDLTLEYFKKTSFFLMPTMIEIFGMVFLESFANKCLPISLNTYAINEIITPGFDGILVDFNTKFYDKNFHFIDNYNFHEEKLFEEIYKEELNSIVNALFKKIKNILFDEDLYSQLVMNGYFNVTKGKFSKVYRNQCLEKIFNN